MATREAACHCGQLRLQVAGDPFAVSICNCLACQRRTGSAFGMQAGFKADQVQIVGRFNDYTRISDEADRREHVFHFCPDCGSQVFYTEADDPDLVVVSIGAFADPSFPPPTESGYDSRRHPWVGLPASVVCHAPELWWESVTPLHEAGRYEEAADRARAGGRSSRVPRPALWAGLHGEPRRPEGRCARASRARDRDLGRLPELRGGGFGLRSNSRRAGVPGADGVATMGSLCPPAETISVPSSSSRASATSTRWKP